MARLAKISLGLPALLVLALSFCGCGPEIAGGAPGPGQIAAVGAESQYANVIAQIGGAYVHASSVLDNPNTDPHTFESSPSVARQISIAQLVVQNGVGYDTFMGKMESAGASSHRDVIVVQKLLGLPSSTPNPHLWYDPRTMPAVAAAVAADLSRIQPNHTAYFQSNLRAFDVSLQPWLAAIASFRAAFAATPAATTEPVADYLLQAMGIDNLTPFRFQAAIMNGTDPTPQDISYEQSILRDGKVKVFCYNAQVVDSLTESLRSVAESHGVPVVAVYETMPTPGYDFQTWMQSEVSAIRLAVTEHTSTEHL